MAELFQEIVKDVYRSGAQNDQNERKKYISQISEHSKRITKARELLLNDDIEPEDYKIIKREGEEKIIRLEAKINDLSVNVNNFEDIMGFYIKL